MAEATKVGSIFYDTSLDTKGFTKGQNEVQSGLKNLKNSFNSLSPAIKTLGAGLVAYISAREVVNFFKSTIDAANESNRVMAQTNAVVASTGMVAGITAEQVNTMAKGIQSNTTISDEAAQQGMNMLLTFTKIGSDIFPQVTAAVMDMATAMNGGLTPGGQELASTAIQIGKAMQDPILGVTALRRVGVNFNATQTDMIQKMVESGHQMDAQKYILAELAREFGGSASAQVGTFEGQMLQLGNQFDDFKENVGRAVIPLLSFLGDALSNSTGGFGVLVGAVKVASTILIGFAALVESVIVVVGALGKAFMLLVSGQFDKMGSLWESTNAKLLDVGVNAQTKMTNVWSSETTKQVGIVQKAADQETAAYDKKAAKMKKDLEDETQSYNDALIKRNKSFDQSMADIIWAHQDKVKELQKSINDENKSFNKSMDDQVSKYEDAMLTMEEDHKKTLASYQQDLTTETSDHATKVATIQALIDQENSYGKNARQSKLREYQQELADEMLSYGTKTAEIQTKIDEENLSYTTAVATKKAANDQEILDLQTKHNQQLLDYQTELTTEQDILNAHQTEVNAVKDKARTDDITRLIMQHNDENIEADKQHLKRMVDIVAQNSAEGTAGGAAFGSAIGAEADKTKTALDQTTKDMATNMATNLSEGAKDAGSKMFTDFMNSLISKGKDALKFVLNQNLIGIGPFSALKLFNDIPAFNAMGTPNFKGGLSWVGERGPELVNLPKGSDVISNQDSKGIMGGGVNIYVDHISNDLDIDSLARELAFRTSIRPR